MELVSYFICIAGHNTGEFATDLFSIKPLHKMFLMNTKVVDICCLLFHTNSCISVNAGNIFVFLLSSLCCLSCRICDLLNPTQLLSHKVILLRH
jgi:hypothetical protein